MHIVDGTVAPALVYGSLVAGAGLTLFGLRRVDSECMPRVAMLTAAFFAASSIHIPIGVASLHLMLAALCGIVLGLQALPAIAVGLFMQAVLLGHGSLSTLGANLLVQGAAALLAAALFSLRTRLKPRWTVPLAFLAGFLGTACALGLWLASVLTGPEGMPESALIVGLAHLPLLLVEGALTASAVSFLLKVRPGLLAGRPGAPPARAKVADAMEEAS